MKVFEISFSFQIIIGLWVLISVDIVKCEQSEAQTSNVESILSSLNIDHMDKTYIEELQDELDKFNKLDTDSKIILLESLWKELEWPEDLRNDIGNLKRTPKLRSMKNSERKRPGWELAYGRRKRSFPTY